MKRLQEYAKANNSYHQQKPAARKAANNGIFDHIGNIEITIEETTIPSSRVRLPGPAGSIKKSVANQLGGLLDFQECKPSVDVINIHHNWVKIGYNQYDILLDTFGREHIELDAGEIVFVKEDRYGRKYLAQ